jgi:hypothetical protein
MNAETEAILKAMGLIPFDAEPDPEDGTITCFKPETSGRPKLVVKIFPGTTPLGLFQAIWNAGGEAKKLEIAKAREGYLATLA